MYNQQNKQNQLKYIQYCSNQNNIQNTIIHYYEFDLLEEQKQQAAKQIQKQKIKIYQYSSKQQQYNFLTQQTTKQLHAPYYVKYKNQSINTLKDKDKEAILLQNKIQLISRSSTEILKFEFLLQHKNEQQRDNSKRCDQEIQIAKFQISQHIFNNRHTNNSMYAYI
eukprot:TRINITY_DN6592_c1_g1_i1.p1 TRINITY_DN6592_c1_g1~~TRINITY_DN6592_c1_g1_i1.p1  ORF type:complete len:166 (-),score=5.05 TRINITY_DN6592_c1_g1_i1:44-541(-)